jgi:hypothetical protein
MIILKYQKNLSMLGEKMTPEISGVEKPEGLIENKKLARRGGNDKQLVTLQ